MTRCRLRNRFLRNRIEENRKLFCKQRNMCVSLLRKSKTDYFENVNEKNITDNERFWKTVKPFFSKKIHVPKRINLTEEEKNSLLTKCEEVAKELNNFFANAAKNLSIPNYENCHPLAENVDDSTLKVIAKWRNHPSILAVTPEYENRVKLFFLKTTFLQK